MAVLVGAIESRSNISDNAVLELDGSFGVHAVKVGLTTYVYVASRGDDGVSGFEVGPTGLLSNVFNVTDAGALELDGAVNFASAKVGGQTYLYVSGQSDSGISAFRVNVDGSLTSVQNIADDATLALLGPTGRMSVTTIGTTSYLIAPGETDDGFSVFRVNANGTLTNTDNVTDAGNIQFELDGIVDVATTKVGGRTFALMTAFSDGGLSVFEIDAVGNAVFRDSVDDASDPALLLNGADGVATARIGLVTYVVAASQGDDGLSVFTLSDTGQLTNVFNLPDSPLIGLDGAYGIRSFKLDGEVFFSVSSRFDDAITIVHLNAGGTLTDVTTIFDNAGLELDATFFNTFVRVGKNPILIGAGDTDDGVSSFLIGAGDDTLAGTAGADLMLGLAGADKLNGGDGPDRMIGGTGDDLYVVAQGGDEVVERRNGGEDSVRSTLSYKLGAQVENLRLLTGGTDGAGNGLANKLDGNGAANELKGQGGSDNLLGRGGADELLGQAGVDRIFGGNGADAITGGLGRDVLKGEGGADDFVYLKSADSGSGGLQRDRILDFRGQDDIVLTSVDANATVAGNQAFGFDTGGGFTAGEIRFRQVGADVLVEMNTDADAKAEMSILLVGFTGVLDNSDFVV